jgi:hypothetical protein
VADEAWPENPALVVPRCFADFVALWDVCRGGMGGVSHWPDAGGVGDQAAWVVDAFGILARTAGEWDEADRRRRGQG